MILFILLCIFVLFVIGSWVGFLRDSKSLNVPGPTPLPIIGNGNLFLVDSSKLLHVFSDLATKFGDAYRVYIMSQRFIVLSHPKYIEEIMLSTETITKGQSYNYVRPWLGDGLLTSTGHKWKNHRKFLTPAFHYNILHSFMSVFLKNEKILSDLLKERADGISINLFPTIALAALDNITESIMGVSFNAQKDRESTYVKAIDEVYFRGGPIVTKSKSDEGISEELRKLLKYCSLTQIISARMRNLFLGNDALFSLTPFKKKQDRDLAVLHTHTNKVIETRRRELQQTNAKNLNDNIEIGMKNKHAFLDLLLSAKVEGKSLNDQCVRDEVETFMFEGHDTTSSGIVYNLYCIAKHPKVQERILEEQIAILGNDIEREPTYSDLKQMKYLESVIKETLRLYPSVPLIQRLITQDVEMSGIRFVKDSNVLINIYAMHRNPAVFEDPLEFRPERFEASNSPKSPFAWIPFSAGPRNCIGQKFAMMEMKVTLAAVVRRFLLLPGKEEPEPCGDLILRSKNGVHVKMFPRI